MQIYLFPIRVAMFAFPFIAALIVLPVYIYQYRKFGLINKYTKYTIKFRRPTFLYELIRGDFIMNNHPIGLLDSGDGGFTVVKKVIKNYQTNQLFLSVITHICPMAIRMIRK